MTSLRPRRPRARIALPLTAVVLTGVLAACGSSSDAGSDDTAAAASADSALAAELPESVASAGEISFGALWETPPVISVTTDDTSTPVGAAPDLADALTALLGVKATWQNMQWPAQLPGVQSGNVDALFGQVSATAERETSVVDLIPFYRSSMALLMLSEDASGVSGLASMCGKSVGVPVGSIQSETVKTVSDASCAGNAISIKEYSGATAAISAVKAGTIDAWMDSATSQAAVVTESGSTFAAVTVPDSEFEPQYTTIAVSKDQPELTQALYDAMKEIIDNGTYDQIMTANDLGDAEISADELVVNPVTQTPIGEASATASASAS